MLVIHAVEELLNKLASELVGEYLEEVIEEIDYHPIEGLLNVKIDNY